jgi:hypothetical protein
VFAEFSPRHLVHFLSFNFHEVPPITNRALDGHLGTMFHMIVRSSESGVRSQELLTPVS